MRLGWAIVVAAVAAANTGAAMPTDPVRIETGLVTGVAADSVESFKGLPFAAPPVGALRWRAPQPAASGRVSAPPMPMARFACNWCARGQPPRAGAQKT